MLEFSASLFDVSIKMG